MSAKKTLTKVKALTKKVLNELKKKKSDFSVINKHITDQLTVVNTLRDKLSDKAINKLKSSKKPVKKKKKSSTKKTVRKSKN